MKSGSSCLSRLENPLLTRQVFDTKMRCPKRGERTGPSESIGPLREVCRSCWKGRRLAVGCFGCAAGWSFLELSPISFFSYACGNGADVVCRESGFHRENPRVLCYFFRGATGSAPLRRCGLGVTGAVRRGFRGIHVRYPSCGTQLLRYINRF
jgi:hypothetical protein